VSSSPSPCPPGSAEPVPGFGCFEYAQGSWAEIFDRQAELIKGELKRAQREGRSIVYLSCPISPRGGGISRTNVDIAAFTARRLVNEWGERLFVLNPAAYQMESQGGTGLILDRIREIWPDENAEEYLKKLMGQHTPRGGDYMRMWVRVLVEDDQREQSDQMEDKVDLSAGGMFDSFYFLGPTDGQAFFSSGRRDSLTQSIEGYFARKYTSDWEFKRQFDVGIDDPKKDPAAWERARRRFYRFYALRASVGFSLGCRDEWNIMVKLNRHRREVRDAYGPGEEIACWFDGRQVNPPASTMEVEPGYEVVDGSPQATATAAPVSLAAVGS
jgi:hypothetical protein